MVNDIKVSATVLIAIFIFFCVSAIAQARTEAIATWVSGSDSFYNTGVYGVKGVTDPNNIPGGRHGGVSWTDDTGNYWLFGGYGYDSTGNISKLNDLWKYDGTNWTWISGSDLTDQAGVYGTKGVADPANVPGARERSISWTDNDGNLWLFGGKGRVGSLTGNLNDLWKFDGTNWTWVSGSDFRNSIGVYGTKGVADLNNMPGARYDSVSWIDSESNLWLFGGYGFGNIFSEGMLNDLWKYDGTNWTWVSGSDTTGQPGVYGTKGIADPNNVPCARYFSVSWTDSGGNGWLFGGQSYDNFGNYGRFNDLWKFDGTNWMWVSGSDTVNNNGVYGTKGVADVSNVPGGRESCISWTDNAGDLWLLGGQGYDISSIPGSSTSYGYLNDLWKYDGVNWTWVSGSDTKNQAGVYGYKGIADPSNTPGARLLGVSWTDGTGNLMLFGGIGRDRIGMVGERNDFWKFDGANWTWMDGSDREYNIGIYGTKGVADSANIPGARQYSTSWKDSTGDLWLFGGGGYDSVGDEGKLNDLWKFDGTNWTWVSGSDITDQLGVYGTKGVADAANTPSARYFAFSWSDINGFLWLFGGDGYDCDGNRGNLNDLWKFDGTNWTWVMGSDIRNQPGVYGTKGVADPNNIPDGRSNGVSWVDNEGNFWLFGGSGYSGYLNDLWKFDGTNWTWISGSSTGNSVGIYGTKGVADAANIPGGRYGSVSWTDGDDNLWLFGGYGYDSIGDRGWLNDLWKYNISSDTWTWVSGSDTEDQPGIYGIKGIADVVNTPGARGGSVSWMDSEGNLWLFGGRGYDSAGVNSYLNDLWKYDISTDVWAWIRGSDTINNSGVYSGSSAVPGARVSIISWNDSDGNAWIFGGYCHDSDGVQGILNDLWKIETDEVYGIFYVDDDASGVGDGSNWADAFNDLDGALTVALRDDTIIVGQGVYLPDPDGLADPREAAFALVNGVTVKGGYAGWGASDPNEWDIELYETILSGDLNGDDDSIMLFEEGDDQFTIMYIDPNRIENCYHVFYHHDGLGLAPNAVLDGFTITGGNAIGAFFSQYSYGGGMCNESGSPTVTNCIFRSNLARDGAGIYNDNSSPTLINCLFSDNLGLGVAGVGGSGGGICNYNNSNPTVSGSIFSDNSADRGGGICNDNSSPAVTNCIFSGNSALHVGGGMCNYDSNPIVTNCTFIDNWVDEWTFDGQGGGGMYNSGGNPVVTNCILWGNTALSGGNEIALEDSSTIDVDHCDVQGGAAGIYDDGSGNIINWGTHNIDVDPEFIDPNGVDGVIGTGDDNLRLSSGSLCIDAGDNGVVAEAADLDGLGRIVDGDCSGTAVVDMGAYEFDWLYLGDFAGGCDVVLSDFGVLAESWGADVPAIDVWPYPDGDGVIDLGELAVLAEHYLEGAL
ncbi:MAG TPA: hypothetical protein ENH94_09360 [Phycisphaerales bacterium]|nr:hypothetical protein [Phycisphaerales bacterium]